MTIADSGRVQKDLAKAGHEHQVQQQIAYEEWLAEQRREGFETVPQQGLDRHDLYNLETAHELDAAMERAALQGVDYTKADKFQRFLEQEAERGVGQVEGRRSLADRFGEIQQQSHEMASLTERGVAAEQIPPVRLHESAQEQRSRIGQERQSPARERLAEIRREHGLEEKPQKEQTVQWGRGR